MPASETKQPHKGAAGFPDSRVSVKDQYQIGGPPGKLPTGAGRPGNSGGTSGGS